MTIWERRVALERQEHKERAEALSTHKAKFDGLFARLREDCAAEGHDFRFFEWSFFGYAREQCPQCGATRTLEDPPFG